jgi:hypothetical protein
MLSIKEIRNSWSGSFSVLGLEMTEEVDDDKDAGK